MSVAPPNFPDLKTGQVESYLHPSVSVPEGLNQNVLVTTVDRLYNWSRRSSMWPLLFGLACCAIEMIATASSRFDLSRFGMEVMRPSPRQSDLMIVSGTVTKKMVPAIVRIYNQMAEPRYVIAMGACATGGGPFKEGYNVVSGIDKYVPVDVYIPGCPPTPEALMFGLMKMHQKVDTQSVTTADWYKREGSAFVPVPQLGPDIFDPRQTDLIRAETMSGEAAVAETDGGRAEGGVPGGLRNLGEKAKARIAQAKERAAARLAG